MSRDPKTNKARYVFDNIIGIMDSFNAPEKMPRFTRAEYTTELEKEIDKLKHIIEGMQSSINLREPRIKSLEDKIEAMKCCDNCSVSEVITHKCYNFQCKYGYSGGTLDNWQMKDGE